VTTETFPGTFAACGRGLLPGVVWRPGDPVKHLGPPESLGIPAWSRLFQTRCGLDNSHSWQTVEAGQDDDIWCAKCLSQAGIPYREESW
jgi:hypothetical protein